MKIVTDSIEAYPEPMAWPRDQQLRYVRGFGDGEGGPRLYFHKGKSGALYPHIRSVVLSNTDLRLLVTAQRILFANGMVSTIYLDQKAGAKRSGRVARKDSFVLMITSGESLKRFSELVGFTNPDKAAKLERIVASYKRFLKRVISPQERG